MFVKLLAYFSTKKGYKCIIAFVIQMEGVTEVRANVETHKEFGVALDEAKRAGVIVKFLQCKVTEDSLEILSESQGS